MAAFEWDKGGEWGGKPWSAELPTDSALVFYLFASYLAAPQWLFPQVGRTRCMFDFSGWACLANVLPLQLAVCTSAAGIVRLLCSQGDATAISGLSGTLYLGKLPTKPADGYVGVLPSRPPASPKVCVVVGCWKGALCVVMPAFLVCHASATHCLQLACALLTSIRPATWLLQGTAVVGLQLGTQQPLFALIVAGDNIYAASGSTALLQVLLLFLRLCQQELGGALGGRHIQHLELAHVLKPYRWAVQGSHGMLGLG